MRRTGHETRDVFERYNNCDEQDDLRAQLCAHNEVRICVAARQEQVVSAGASWWTILDLNQ